jgi:nucleoside-diphosphate-sugar epimerase
MDDNLRILLTGATGFVGRHLIIELITKYRDITVLARKTSDISSLRNSGIKIKYGELSDVSSLANAADNIDIIIHLAALMSDKDYLPYSDFYKTNVLGTRNLLSVSSGRIKQFILVSTVGVFGATPRKGLDESAPYGRVISKYERSKVEAEKYALDFCAKNKVNLTILRLGQLYGPGMKYGWPQVLRSIEGSRMFILGKGEKLLHLTNIQDAVNGILVVIDNEKSYGEIFNICAKDACEVKEVFFMMADKLDKPNPKFIPLFPVYCLAAVMELFPRKIKPKALQYLDTHRLGFFRFNHVYKINKAQALLGYFPKISLEEGITELVSWYKKDKGDVK